jgi:16S rRNA (cytosine967-C5)-methyltransferase
VDLALSSRTPVDGALAAVQAALEPRDRRLLQQLVHGTLRWLLRLDDVIARAADRPLERIDGELRAPLRVGAFQLLFLDRIPAHAAVSEAVDEARRRAPRGAGFANAVLRRISRAPRLEEWPVERADPIERLAVESSHPLFLVRRWLDAFGREATEGILRANNGKRPLQLLAVKGERARVARLLAEEGVSTHPLELAPDGLEVEEGNALATEAFAAGEVYAQDQASQAAALIPPPQAGERVLDAAAAPGGKSFALLARQPGLEVTAADVAVDRALLLRANCERLGRRLPLLVADAARPALGATFDRVIVDLPCTGTGILARHPDLKWRLGEKEIGRLAARAARLVAGAAALVRPGGQLVAITCSIEQEENEQVTHAFLERSSSFELLPLDERLEPAMRAGVGGPGFWRLLPSASNDGFTVHVMRRRRAAV